MTWIKKKVRNFNWLIDGEITYKKNSEKHYFWHAQRKYANLLGLYPWLRCSPFCTKGTQQIKASDSQEGII